MLAFGFHRDVWEITEDQFQTASLRSSIQVRPLVLLLRTESEGGGQLEGEIPTATLVVGTLMLYVRLHP